MKKMVKACLWALFFCGPLKLAAQVEGIKLLCPLNDALIVPPPKNTIQYSETDLCIVLQSQPDTLVKSVGAGRITNIEFTDETQNGVVLFVKIKGKDYYFWYTGMTKLLVRRNDVVKLGQPLGYISPGGRIELIMYEFETQVDPIKFLDCKNILNAGNQN